MVYEAQAAASVDMALTPSLVIGVGFVLFLLDLILSHYAWN